MIATLVTSSTTSMSKVEARAAGRIVTVWRDLVIQQLAEDEARLRARLAGVEADAAVLRELLDAALDALRFVTLDLKGAREQHARTCVEYRELRERLLLAAETA